VIFRNELSKVNHDTIGKYSPNPVTPACNRHAKDCYVTNAIIFAVCCYLKDKIVLGKLPRFVAKKELFLQAYRGRSLVRARADTMPDLKHRNLRSSTRKLAQVLQTFWAKKNLVKSLLISALDKVIYYIGTFLQGSTKTSLHYTK
jgi:hypothetical protein